MNIDNELNCVDLIKAVIKIHNICNSKSLCGKCVFFKNSPCGCIINDFPYDWKIEELLNWLKEHESEETKMSDEELYKAIKEYSENNDLGNVRETNKVLRKIRDTCRSHTNCKNCPYYRPFVHCILNSGIPENWEI